MENKRGFEFGLSVATRCGGAGQNQNEYKATMFDAQEMDKGKLILVWSESGEYKASIVLTDGTEQPLTNTRTVHYRDQDRINTKTKINWAVDLFGALADITSTAVGAATGVQ